MRELDQLARLLVIDGAFGRNFSRQNPRLGLRAARQELGDRLHPSWTDPADSGVYELLRAHVAQVLRKDTIIEADEVLTASLAGVTQTGNPTTNPFVEAGKRFASMITKQTTPLTFAKARLVLWLRRKATNEGNGPRHFEDWSEAALDPTFTQEPNPLNLLDLAEVAFLDRTDPFSQRLWEMMRKSVDSVGYMDYTLDVLERTGKLPKKSDVAAHFGRPQNLFRVWDRFIARTRAQIQADPSMMEALERRVTG